MDIEAIARKVREAVPDCVRGSTIRAVLEAAGVPEMEAQCAAMGEALDRAGEWVSKVKVAEMPGVGDTQGWLLQVIGGALSSTAGRDFLKRLEAAERVCGALKPFVEKGIICPQACEECDSVVIFGDGKEKIATCDDRILRDAFREWKRKEAP